MPPYVKVILTNEFPRSQSPRTWAARRRFISGRFAPRSTAERFESQFLDLFQMRRCQEDLVAFARASRLHLRRDGHVPAPLPAGGERRGISPRGRPRHRFSPHRRTLARRFRHRRRDRASTDLDFEQAARQHKRIEKIEEVLGLRDELARDIDRLNGVAVTASVDPQAVELWFVLEGCWQPPAPRHVRSRRRQTRLARPEAA